MKKTNSSAMKASTYKDIPRYVLRGFEFKNFKGIQYCDLNGLPENARWVFLAGENGYGKTSVLQALATGLFGFEGHTFEYEKDESSFRVEIMDNTSGKVEKFDPKSGKPQLKQICCYGSSRLDMVKESSSKGESPTLSLYETQNLLRNIELQLSRWYFKQDDSEFREKYEHVIKILKTLLNVSKIEVDRKSDQVYYYEKDEEGEQYERLLSKHLAAGYRSLISMIGDMILRLFEVQPEVRDPAKLTGIVIIDEIDLHFHPKLQRSLPGELSRIFPKIYFIASTHSSIPILGAPANAVILRVNRSKKSGVTVERLAQMEKQLPNLTPNILLTSPIFGLQDIFPATHQINKNRIQTEDTYADMELNEKVEARLKAYQNTDREKELLKLFKGKK